MVFDLPAGGSATTQLTNLAPETWYHFRAAASNSAGVVFGSNQTFRTVYFTRLRLAATFSGTWQASIAWGDYDGDADLDLAFASYGHGPYLEGRILRNDAGSFVGTAILSAFYRNQVSWVDYDNDGNLDVFAANSARPELLRNVAGNFSAATPNLPRSSLNPTEAWGDLDNDGDLDLFFAIGTNTGRIFVNDLGTIRSMPTADIFPDTHARAATWIDYNNDGHLDLAVATFNEFSLWSNTNGVLTKVDAGFSNVTARTSAWADYDLDGDLDVLLICDDPTKTGLYRNDAGEFSRVNLSLPALEAWRSFASWGDVDNDGDPDLLLSGRVPSQTPPAMLELYRNDGGVLFPVQAGLGGLVDGEAQWGDYDNDGDLDVVAFGGGPYSTSDSEGVIYKNESSRSNSPPSAPTNITARAVGNSIIISWNASTDAETPLASLTYNLAVGTTPDGCEIMSPHARLATGVRLVPAMGNVGFRRSHMLTNLPPAKAYYYSVQAVDAGFAGSPFSARGVIALIPVIETIRRFGPVIAVQGHGPPGTFCNLFVSTNLVTWRHPLGVSIDTNGFWEYWDPDFPSTRASFYKVTAPDE